MGRLNMKGEAPGQMRWVLEELFEQAMREADAADQLLDGRVPGERALADGTGENVEQLAIQV